MATYRMSDGTVVKVENAVQAWNEDMRWDGSNHISVATGSQWSHQKLHCSRKGRYWLECWSNYQGSAPHAEWVSNQEATRWLLANDESLPPHLKPLKPRFRSNCPQSCS